MAKTKKTTTKQSRWKGPDGNPLAVGQLLDVNAATRLGPSSIGQFIIRSFTDEGIRVAPTSDHGFGVQEIRIQPEDIVTALPPA